MTKNIDKILRIYLTVTCLYLIGDGLYHVLNIKLYDASLWPKAPLIYSGFIGRLYGLFAIFSAILGMEAQRNLTKYKNFLYIAALWLMVYGSFLIYSSLTTDFEVVFSNSPSIFVWMPFYNAYLIIEATLAFTFSLLVFLWSKKHENN